MANVYAARVVQMNYNFDYQGEPCQNTLYFRLPVSVASVDIDELALALYQHWVAVAAPFVPDTVVLRNLEGHSLDSATAPIGGHSPAGPADGDLSSPAASNNVTIAVSFRTGLAGRSNRGRNYWIGLLESNIANNRLTPSVMTAIIGYYAALLGDTVIGPEWVWGVYSRYLNNSPRAVGLFTPITQVKFVNDVCDTMRNRMP